MRDKEVSFEIWKLLNRFSNFCHPNNQIKLIVDCLKTILKVLKRHITGTNFHKKSKSTQIVKSIQYFLPSGKSIKLSKFQITFFNSGSITLIIGTKYHKKSENFVQLKDGHAYYYKKIFIFAKRTLFGEFLTSSKNLKIFKLCIDVLSRISNKKEFCQINFCEYRGFIFRKSAKFIAFVEIVAYSMCNFCK